MGYAVHSTNANILCLENIHFRSVVLISELVEPSAYPIIIYSLLSFTHIFLKKSPRHVLQWPRFAVVNYNYNAEISLTMANLACCFLLNRLTTILSNKFFLKPARFSCLLIFCVSDSPLNNTIVFLYLLMIFVFDNFPMPTFSWAITL